MIHVGLHSVGTYHKNFGRQNKKNKNILCRVSRDNTRQSRLCRVPTMGVFGLAFGFDFCPLKAKSQTKGLDPESSFF
jgi:hypothetical protein